MTDNKIDQAIRALSAEPAPPTMAQIPMVIESTGRVVVIAVPEDVTDLEVMEVTAWMLRSLRGHIQANRPSSPLIVARGKLPT